MSDSLNLLKNPDFSKGKERPSNWTWLDGESQRVAWRRQPVSDGNPTPAMEISGDTPGSAAWTQVIKMDDEEDRQFRIEAVVQAELQAAADAELSGRPFGAVLTVQPQEGRTPVGQAWQSGPLLRTGQPTTVRMFLPIPDDADRIEVGIGVASASGHLRIEEVRVMEMLELEEAAHALGLPVPAYAQPAPRRSRQVGLAAADRAKHERLFALLQAAFGERSVRWLDPATLPGSLPADLDALFLPDARLHAAITTIEQLIALAESTYVVGAPALLAAMSKGAVKTRTVEQLDDPMHARVSYADYLTGGFALRDAFPFAGNGTKPGSFRHIQFRASKQLTSFCEKHEFRTSLTSLCDKDATSDQPLCLHRPTDRGGLIAMDLSPLCNPVLSTCGEPNAPMHLLLTALGAPPATLGQYMLPPNTEISVREHVREMSVRFRELVLHQPNLPPEELHHQVLTVGGQDHTFGLPHATKPVLLIRSGLRDGDAEAVFGAMQWCKQLVRMEPHRCPFLQSLARRYQLAWEPLVAGWNRRPGCSGGRAWAADDAPWPESLQDQPVAAVVDVVTRPDQQIRVVRASTCKPAFAERLEHWLPSLRTSFGSPPAVAHVGQPEQASTNRSGLAWRTIQYPLQVEVSDEGFCSPAHQHAAAHDADFVRIEVPGSDFDTAGLSIIRTDAAAVLLDLVVGLHYGLIAMNRTASPVTFNGWPPVASGEALIVEPGDAMLLEARSQAG